MGPIRYVARRTVKYLAPHVGLIAVTWGISIVIVFLQSLTAWLGAEYLIRLLQPEQVGVFAVFDEKTSSFVLDLFEGIVAVTIGDRSRHDALIWGVVVLSGAGISVAVLRVIKLYLIARMNQSILFTIRQKLFYRLTHLESAFSKNNRPGEVTSLFINDVNQLNYLFVDAADRLFMQPIRLLLALYLMLSLSWELTLWSLAVLIPGGVVIHFIGLSMHKLTDQTMTKIATVSGHLTEYLSTALIARSMAREDFERTKFAEETGAYKNLMTKTMLYDAMTPQVVKLLFILSVALLLIIGGHYLFVAESIAAVSLLKLAFLLPLVAYPMEALATLYVSYQSSSASALRLFKLLDEPVKIDDQDGVAVDEIKKAIEFKNVRYDIEGEIILSNVSFAIPTGSLVCFFGPSGAGKSTLLSLLAKFDIPDAGNVLIDQTDLVDVRGDLWREKLGIITQEPTLLYGTIRDNLVYAKSDAFDDEIKKVLHQVGLLTGKTDRLPDGLDTQVGNRGEKLSGGERQRVTIARALLRDPILMLIDEPTTQLDAENKQRVIEALQTLRGKMTIVVATHDQEVKKIADRVITINHGAVTDIDELKG